MVRASLECHPQSGNAAVRRIDASVSRSADGMLAVSYVLEGDLEGLRVPAWDSIRLGERLWERTCFEMFIRKPRTDAYHELNFAPSGAWAAYAFERYREGAPLADAALDPQIAVRRRENVLELEAGVSLERLSTEYLHVPLALALSAVIEDGAGVLSYWALAHPAGKPDFHHRDSFQLVIPAEAGMTY